MISKKIAAVLVLVFLTTAPNVYAAKCSNATLKGTYAYLSQGFQEAPLDISSAGFVPFAQTGLIVYDGHGSIVSGTFSFVTTTAAGGSFRGTFTGTYSVNPDCSGTAHVQLEDGTPFQFDILVQGATRHTFVDADATVGFISVYSFQRVEGDRHVTETK